VSAVRPRLKPPFISNDLALKRFPNIERKSFFYTIFGVENFMTKKKNLPGKIVLGNVVIKDGLWYVRKSYLLKGKRKQLWRKCENQTAKHAAEILQTLETEIFQLQNPVKKPNPKYFHQLAKRYAEVELIEPVFVAKRKIAGKKSVERNRYHLKVLTKFFGEMSLDEITFSTIHEFKLRRLKTPIKTKFTIRERAVRSVHYELATLRQVFNFAVRERLLNRSPFQDGKGLIRPSDDNKRFVVLSDEEQKRLIANIDAAKYPYLKVIVICCMDAGFRFGELVNLKWKQVDFENETIELFDYQTKTSRSRVLPMTKRVKAVLMDWKLKARTENVLTVKRIDKTWNTLKLSINRPELHLHDLRHVFATRLHKNGVGIATISKLLGHANIQTTQIYINPSSNELRDAIRMIE
jgi:integrase